MHRAVTPPFVRSRSRRPPVDLGDLLARLSSNMLDDEHRDLIESFGGSVIEPYRLDLGWSALARRDLNLSSGGALATSDTTEAAQALRPYSAVLASGPRVLQSAGPNVLVPTVTTPISAEWLATEADGLTAVQPVLGQRPLSPKWIGALVKVTRQLLLQGRAVGDLIASELLGAVGAALDKGFLQGIGSAGQPQGLTGISGIGTASGGTLTYAMVATAIETVLAAGGREPSLGFICTPAVASVLKQRARISGGRAVMDDGVIDGYAVRVTANCPAGVLLLADWQSINVALFGIGPRVESDPSTGFKTGATQYRVLTSADIAPSYASMIYTLTGVS
jgi:HK97 family phage major capsid protein